MTPKISVIVPIYNAELYLRQCLESILSQTLEDIEIICVNDGSIDNTAYILTSYSEKDSRLKVINQANTGVSGARNNGLKIAAGEFVMFVDCDDWIDARTCEELYEAAIHENADCVMCSYTKEFDTKSVVNHIFNTDYMVVDKIDIKYKFHRRLFGLVNTELTRPEDGDLIVSACMQIFKKKMIAGINFIDLKLIGTSEDALYQIYSYYRCNKFVYIDKPYYHYRKNNINSLTSVHKTCLFEQWQNLFDIMEEFISTNCNEQVYFEALNNRIVLSMIGLGLNEIRAMDKSIFQKAKRLQRILKTPRYIAAYKNFKFYYLPFKWKVFFYLCRYKLTLFLIILLYIIEFLRKNSFLTKSRRNNEKNSFNREK